MPQLSDINRALVESKGPVAFTERLAVPAGAIKQSNEANKPGQLDWVSVSRAGSPANLNRRIYPEAVMAVAIDRVAQKIKDGLFRGAVDHPCYDGGMKNSPILWRGLKLDQQDNMVRGYPLIVAEHSDGRNLIALLQAGSGLAFSTRGTGSAHKATPEEMAKYGLKDELDDDVVIINDDYEMIAVDVVDSQSCQQAYEPGNLPPASETRHSDSKKNPPTLETEIMFKTLEELKAQNPDLHKLHEAAIALAVTAAVAAAEAPLKTQISERDTTLEAEATKLEAAHKFIADFNKFQEGLVAHPFVKVGERQVSTAEDAAKVEAANKERDAAKAEALKAANDLKAVEQKLAVKAEAEKQAERKIKVAAKIETMLKDNKFAEEIKSEITDGKLADAAAFDEAAAEKFIADRAAAYEKIAKRIGSRDPMWGIYGHESSKGASDDKKEDSLDALCV